MSVSAISSQSAVDIDLSILYVEDENVPRQRLASIMKRRVREIHEARDGQEGLDMYREIRPDLIVTDIRMPRMDGLRMVHAIRRENPETKVIVTTAFSETPLLIAAIDLDVDGYILKPVDTVKLFATITRCAETIYLRRSLEEQDRKQKQLISELSTALAEIKILQDILPICSGCKKIRNDKGYWEQVDHYITRHTDTKFSHGICPDCMRALYPDLADKILKELDEKS